MVKQEKTNLIIAQAGALSLLFTAAFAQADEQCESATITKAGIYSYSNNSRTIYAICDDQAAWGSEQMFFIPKDKDDDAMYAAALTALASGYKADLTLSKFTEGSLVRAIIVIAP